MTPVDERIVAGVSAFNERRYLDAHLLFEAVWLEQRTDELKGLVQTCNIMHLLHQNLYTAARRSLIRAQELLVTAPQDTQIDLSLVCQGLRGVLLALPAELQSGMPAPPDLVIPHFQMKWLSHE